MKIILMLAAIVLSSGALALDNPPMNSMEVYKLSKQMGELKNIMRKITADNGMDNLQVSNAVVEEELGNVYFGYTQPTGKYAGAYICRAEKVVTPPQKQDPRVIRNPSPEPWGDSVSYELDCVNTKTNEFVAVEDIVSQ